MTMPLQPLKQNDFYFDNILNAILSADGTVNSYDCHELTMLWPSYSAIDLPDTAVQRLTPCKFDHWTNEMEYIDPITNQTIRINLVTGLTSTVAASAPPTPPPSWGAPKSSSQQNAGWAYVDTSNAKIVINEPFKKGAVLFHKPTRTKWTYDSVDSLTRNYILRSFYDKAQATQFFKKDLNEFEEMFF